MRFGALIIFPHFSAQLGEVGIQAPSLVWAGLPSALAHFIPIPDG
jgi:hypothetical protein